MTNGRSKEPLFIKNLENVQGDERDVIFISTTYGPERVGVPTFQRFGPINSDVGWRRLNVIATRARQRVEVFTSMQPSDILVGGPTRRGVRAFRDYLEYAQTGRVTEDASEGGAPENEFELAVGALIVALGYEVVPQVGVAGFFIDLGVRHPDRPGEYLAGIECDGAPYHSSTSARDRDRLRQTMLQSKGWSIHRIWSTDWFHTRNAEVDRLKGFLAERLASDRQARPLIDIAEPLVTTDTARTEALDLRGPAGDQMLAETLERFWKTSIAPEFPDRESSILSEPILRRLVISKPETRQEFLDGVPLQLRERIDRRQSGFLDDILEIVRAHLT